mgnify:CR=1 FL=1
MNTLGVRDCTEGPVAGPAHDLIDRTLTDFVQYRRFRAGWGTREAFCRWVRDYFSRGGLPGLNEDQANLATRFPKDERRFVAEVLAELHDSGMARSREYSESDYQAFRDSIEGSFEHRGRATYIFPEEARLLYALTQVSRPQSVLFLGSYYGYWAAWAMPGVIAAGGHATLVDVDPDAMECARANFERAGFAAHADFVVADATRPCGPGEVDLVVLDAEGPKERGPEELRDKAIYAPIMLANSARLRPGGLLVAHNMLLENLTSNPYFLRKIGHNQAQYDAFQRHLDEEYDLHRVVPTTEGVGIYRKATAGGAR